MKVIGYLESSLWTMRGLEFGTMMRQAYAHADQLDALLASPEKPEGSRKPESMFERTGERLSGTRYVQVRDGVAVIDVNGVIAKRMNMFDEICYGGTSTEFLMRDFGTCMRSANVESIVLNIDSPGGEAFGINEFAESVFKARGDKPIHAYVSGLGCSGAYWIASAAEKLILDKSAFVGSIGVVTAWMDDKEFYKMMGIRREVVTSSNAPFKRLNFDNDEHRAELQRELDSLESVFHKAVARNRNVTVKEVINDFNKGGVLAGTDAVKAKMADRVGSLEDVIRDLAKVKTIASFGANKTGEMNMSVASKLKEKVSAFFASDEIKPLLEDGKEYAIVERTAASAEEGGETDPEKPAVAGEGEEAEENPTPEASAKPAVAPPGAAGADNQISVLQGQVAQSQAEAFIAAEMAAGRLVPAEKAGLQSLFIQAATDDFKSPLASGSRVETLKAHQSARKPHGLDVETVNSDANEIFVLSLGKDAKTKMDRDIDAQVDSYVATVSPGGKKLEAVK